jgi:hypothetical protein
MSRSTAAAAEAAPFASQPGFDIARISVTAPAVQRKPVVGAAGDRYEREADDVAERATRGGVLRESGDRLAHPTLGLMPTPPAPASPAPAPTPAPTPAPKP